MKIYAIKFDFLPTRQGVVKIDKGATKRDQINNFKNWLAGTPQIWLLVGAEDFSWDNTNTDLSLAQPQASSLAHKNIVWDVKRLTWI